MGVDVKYKRSSSLLILNVILGLSLRLYYLLTVEIIPVDALEFMNVTLSLHYGTPYPIAREIGYPALLYVIFFFIPISFFKMRILTLIIGTLNIILIYKFALIMTKYYNIENKQDLIAIGSSFLYSTNVYAVRFDNSGVREPLVTLLLLLVLIIVFDYENIDLKRKVLVGLLYYYISITRSEFQYVGLLFALVLLWEGYQHNNSHQKSIAVVIILSSIFGLLSWMLISALLLGDPNATSKFLVNQIIKRNSPGTESGSFVWYIFEYRGIGSFVVIEIKGIINIILNLSLYLGSIGYILLIFGTVNLFRTQKFSLLLFYVSGAILNGFNAHEWNYIGTDRILLPYYTLLFVVASLSLIEVNDYNLKIKDQTISVPSKYWIILIFVCRLALTIIRLV